MLKTGIPFLTLALTMVSCAKKREFKEDDVKNLLLSEQKLISADYAKNLCTLEDPCLWTPSVADTPYEVTASRPFWQGEAKLVVTKLVEGKLKFLQIEDDSRYQDNINNFSPVAEFAVTHHDYKCAEDAFGDCTNTETEVSDKSWYQKQYIKLANFSVVEKNSLPIQFGELFQAGCFASSNSEVSLVDGGFTTDSLNIRMKTPYTANPNCVALQEMDDLRYLNFTVDYHYSIVRLSSLADKSYQAVEYPKLDESYFGFFTTEQKFRTVDNHDHYMGLRKNFLNRWSPNKKEIVYYLNKDFYKPEMANILASTKGAIDSVNLSLRKANAGIQIKLANGSEKSIGNLKNNFLILVTDPQASGVIGYGPAVTNPKTGEIINARTVMYYGTIQKFIARTYDELVEATSAKMLAMGADTDSSTTTAANTATADKSIGTQRLQVVANRIARRFNQLKTYVEIDQFIALRDRNQDYANLINVMDMVTNPNEKQELLAKNEKEMNANLKRFQERMDLLAKQTFFHGSNVNFEQAMEGEVVAALENDIKNGKTPKFWIDLSEAERQKIMDSLLPMVWIPTLVHEFGHNLGLRHNFYGSIDEDNYYSPQERSSLGIKRPVTYSSIMDYTHSTLNELPVMGKYDIAALKFAYAREVETQAGKTLKISSTLKDLESVTRADVKKFKYCSDEHVSTNPLCNRFDEGKNNFEVAKHYINSFNKNYEKRNFRNRRYNFNSRNGDVEYFFELMNSFSNVRQFFDIYDQRVFNGDFNKKSDDKEEEKILTDIKKAADISFDFFMNILETPAYHCLEYNPKTQQITKVAPFAALAKDTQLAEYGITFDIKLGCQILTSMVNEGKPEPEVIYFSFGKYFNNSLDLLYDRSQILQGDTSQIDVRGSWMDKLVASIMISNRALSPSTIGAASNGNYLDYDEYKDRFTKYMDGLLKNKFSKKVAINNGSAVIAEMEMEYSFEEANMINKSYHPGINWFFGLENTQNNLKSVLMSKLKPSFAQAQRDGTLERDNKIFHDFDADQVSTLINLDRYSYNYKHIVDFKNAAGKVAYRFAFNDYNSKAVELMELKKQIEILADAEQQDVVEAYKLLMSGSDAGEGATEKVKEIVKNVKVETIPDYFSGVITQDVLLTSFLAISK